MPTYIALLRGINVGGNKKVPMADLKKLLEKSGFTNVKTLLNSGNVVLESEDKSVVSVRKTLEEIIAKKFGFPVPTIVRTRAELEKLKKSDPFKGITVTKDTRLYVTFLSEKPKTKLKIPWSSPLGDLKILRVTDGEVCSVFTLLKVGSIEAMKVIEQEFGKNVTTRNWNTVEKLLAA